MIFAVVITKNRPIFLQHRSLPSIAKQTRLPEHIILIDDSEPGFRSENQKLLMSQFETVPTTYLLNEFTPGAAGAWNTAIRWISGQVNDAWIAFLDDDDEWLPEHLEICHQHITSQTHIILSGLDLVLNGQAQERPPIADGIRAKDFLAGNPGWEGSNTFIRLTTIEQAGVFDETLPCTHDRDLAFRTLSLLGIHVRTTGRITAKHYLDFDREALTTGSRKKLGLLRFWKKYTHLMEENVRNAFLKRSQTLFRMSPEDFSTLPHEKHPPFFSLEGMREESKKARLIIGIGFRNSAKTIGRAVKSALEQQSKVPFSVLLLNDSSNDSWRQAIEPYLGSHKIVILHSQIGRVSHMRNHLFLCAKELFPEMEWFCRLDADDEFFSKESIQQVLDNVTRRRTNEKWILAGNVQRDGSRLLDKPNRAVLALKDKQYLLSRLERMASGEAEAELPSCNLWMHRSAKVLYPSVHSAEDHWLLTYLLTKKTSDILLCPDVLLSIYSLNGMQTHSNKKKKSYRQSRVEMFQSALCWTSASHPKNHSNIVLGWGSEGVCRKVGEQVHKEFYPFSLEDNHVSWLQKIPLSPHFPEASWQKTEDSWIAKYRYEELFPLYSVPEEKLIQFCHFCLENNVVYTDFSRHNAMKTKCNSIFVTDIGRDIRPFDISFYLDMCARAFLLIKKRWTDQQLREITPYLRGSAKALSEIDGFSDFYKEMMELYIHHFSAEQPRQHFVPKQFHQTTLLLKCCAMDSAYLDNHLHHIRKQIGLDFSFYEVILLMDSKKRSFLREHREGSWDELCKKAMQAQKRGWITKVIESPQQETSTSEVAELYTRWFRCDSKLTHTDKGIPVFPQLWAFEQVQTPYLMQLDIDVLIGRTDLQHNVLQDMHDALAQEGILGVGFNIPTSPLPTFKNYSAPEGQYVPEVRFGLFDLTRLLENRPYFNKTQNGYLLYSWYRSIEKSLQEKGLRCLRGGDSRTFYIHPGNEHKASTAYPEMLSDWIEQNQIPHSQYNKWDWEGPSPSWNYPKRSEELIVLSIGRNPTREKALRCIQSLRRQTNQQWGAVFVDDASQPDYQAWLREELKELPNSTLVQNQKHRGKTCNQYMALHNICTNPESLIIILDTDDAFFHPHVLDRLFELYKQGFEVIMGGMFRPDKPLKSYKHRFHDTRKPDGGNVWTHLRSFRLKRFTSLPKAAFQIDEQWIQYCDDFAKMIPIVEQSEKCISLPEYLYFHERTTPATSEIRRKKDEEIELIVKKTLPFKKETAQ